MDLDASLPLVSIITPSYNQALYLEETIRSVLGQDYPNIEYLVVDGGSTDGSVEIIRRYADRLAWWVSEADSGQAEAINKGLQRARGEIVAWLNSDDVYLPGAIHCAAAAFQQNPNLGLVFGDALTTDAQGKPLNRLTFGNWGLVDLLRFRIICQPAAFMRRSVLQQAGLLDLSYHCFLDHHLWLRMARIAPIQYIGGNLPAREMDRGSRPSACRPIALAAARHHPDAKNTAQPVKFAREIERILVWLQEQPEMAPLVAQDRRHVLGGAYRLIARYLLDGDMPAEALKYYGLALLYWPGYALKHSLRMFYAMLRLVKLDRLAKTGRQRKAERQRRQLIHQLRNTDLQGLENWPGLRLGE
jgi:glycosyltransferase involved in cell wall biosynthesis